MDNRQHKTHIPDENIDRVYALIAEAVERAKRDVVLKYVPKSQRIDAYDTLCDWRRQMLDRGKCRA